MGEPARRRMTYSDYLAVDATSELKHEFFDGAIVAMAGGTPDHARIPANVTFLLETALRRGPCRSFNSDLRIHVPGEAFAAYPDVSVICGERTSTETDPDCATNPTVLVEVLSDSTERYDRGEKFRRYSELPSLRTYVLVSQHQALVEVYERRADDRWLLTRYEGLDASAHLESVDVALPLAEVYLDAEFLNEPAHTPEPADNAENAENATG